MQYSEALNIPQKCQNCPRLKMIGDRYDDLTQHADDIITGIMDGSTERNITDRMLETGADPEEVARVVDQERDLFREYGSKGVEHIDELREAHVRLGQHTIDRCRPGGSLTLRATRDEREVTVRVCMSDMAERLERMGMPEPAIVHRRRVDG